MSFPYEKILVLGATSGIGHGMSTKFVEEGKKVIVTGRRKENLDNFVKDHGSDKAAAIQVDMGDLDALPAFCERVMKEHSDLDCVFLNAGMQRPFDFADPKTVDLKMLDDEFTVNYLAYVHITTLLLPHLQAKSKQSPVSLIFTSSGLGLIPLVRCSNYSATKAALHHWIMCLREQLNDDSGSDVKIVELMTPVVQTELHDTKHQPDLQNGNQMGMPLREYVDDTWSKLNAGETTVRTSMTDVHYAPDGMETKRQRVFDQAKVGMAKMLSQYKRQ